MSAKEFAKEGFKRTCMRIAYSYVEQKKLPQKEAHEKADEIYKALTKPWESLPDVETAPNDILYVAKNAAQNFFERDGAFDAAWNLMYYDKDCLAAYEKASQRSRDLYDDILKVWYDRPNRCVDGETGP